MEVTAPNGTPEPPVPASPVEVPDFDACGAGTSRCCIFLAMGAGGVQCLRSTDLRSYLIARHESGTMNAKRNPVAPFPDCQSEERYD